MSTNVIKWVNVFMFYVVRQLLSLRLDVVFGKFVAMRSCA